MSNFAMVREAGPSWSAGGIADLPSLHEHLAAPGERPELRGKCASAAASGVPAGARRAKYARSALTRALAAGVALLRRRRSKRPPEWPAPRSGAARELSEVSPEEQSARAA